MVLHRIWSTDWFLRPIEERKRWCGPSRRRKRIGARWDEIAADPSHQGSGAPIRPVVHPADVDFVGAATADTKFAVPRYEEAELSVRRQVDPHETPVAEMMKHVIRVVSVEGPHS